MPYAYFDRDSYPLIIVSFTGDKATDENFSSYLEETSRNYDRREKIAILFDAAKVNFPRLKYQKMQATWLKDNEEMMRNYCVGVAYTIPNALIRKALQLILNIQNQPVPFKVFSTNEMGLDWLRSKLRQAN